MYTGVSAIYLPKKLKKENVSNLLLVGVHNINFVLDILTTLAWNTICFPIFFLFIISALHRLALALLQKIAWMQPTAAGRFTILQQKSTYIYSRARLSLPGLYHQHI